MAEKPGTDPKIVEETWRAYLNTGVVPDDVDLPWYRSKRFSSIYSRLPADPRCRLCRFPFQGMGGLVARLVFDTEPSKLNPQICNYCDEFIKKNEGGAEVEITILFADVRGSTTLAEQMKLKEYGQLIRRFYNTATKILFESNALVEKLLGDAVTAFYTSGISGPEHARRAILDAQAIRKATGHADPSGPWIPVGIGIHTGIAYVGAVLSDSGAADISVLGDTANIGARLASLAGTGEIFVSQATAQAAGLDSAGAVIEQKALKGRSEPVEVWRL